MVRSGPRLTRPLPHPPGPHACPAATPAVRPRAFACPLDVTQAVIGGKWRPSVVWHLFRAGAPLRFAELRRRVPGVSEKVLAQDLRALEREGVVARRVLGGVPPGVEYALTAYGETLRAALDAACAWGEAHAARTGAGLVNPPAPAPNVPP